VREHFAKLVNVRVACTPGLNNEITWLLLKGHTWEKWSTCKQLRKYAANGPHINRLFVSLGAVQKLRGTIPSGQRHQTSQNKTWSPGFTWCPFGASLLGLQARRAEPCQNLQSSFGRHSRKASYRVLNPGCSNNLSLQGDPSTHTEAHFYPMYDRVLVQVLDSAEQHAHVAFHMPNRELGLFVVNDSRQISFHEVEDKVNTVAVGIYILHLQKTNQYHREFQEH
jgi:hypothetical protein